jgi:Zn-dependent protease with chaperone function
LLLCDIIADFLRAAVTIVAIGIAFYFYSFVLFKILLNMAAPLNNEYFQSKTNEFADALKIKVKRLQRLKTFGIPFVLAYATSNRGIYLSDILIDKFTREEASAILAHEISHLKHIKPLILKKFLFYTILILGLFFLTPLVDLFTIEFPINFLFKMIILLGLILFLRVESKISRNYELEADRLAVELVGKDLYIKAIEKIHEINMIPREFKPKEAKTQTHPSLEARIKAIQQSK